jgi:hypothetical protein
MIREPGIGQGSGKGCIEMKQTAMLFLLALFAFPSYAKVKVSVERVVDAAEVSHCPGTAQLRPDLADNVRTQLIHTLIQHERYEIAQREVRPLRPEHRLAVTIHVFEICARKGQPGQDAHIELELRLLNAKGAMSHVFNATAKAFSGSLGVSGEKAITAAIEEIVRRVDSAIPGYRPLNLVYKGGRASRDKDYQVQMIRRPTSIKIPPAKVKTRTPAPKPAQEQPGPQRRRPASTIAEY